MRGDPDPMKLKKGDLIVVILLIMIVTGWYLKDLVWPDTTNKHAVIRIDGDAHSTLTLDSGNEKKEIPLSLPGNNYVHIVSEQDKIWVEDASCPDKVCVNTGKISKVFQSIVCLPNKTVIYIEGTEETDIDDVVF